MSQVTILTVCTANICRSPAAAVLLLRSGSPLLPSLSVGSAGIAAWDGETACDLASALVGVTGSQHHSRRVTREQVEQADLVLALDRTHRSALAQLSPASRTRSFTLRQAAAAGACVTEALRSGCLPEGAPPMPPTAVERFHWWVGELDAHRSAAQPGDQNGFEGLAFDALDVPDPHVVGYQYHPMAIELITSAVTDLTDSLRAVLDFHTHAA